MKSELKTAVMFGGLGFIATNLAEKLMSTGSFDKIYLLDEETNIEKIPEHRKNLINSNNIEIIFCDIDHIIEFEPMEEISCIFNFAAVLREPGHETHEYYATNFQGSINVCNWAKKVGCNKIVYTSSMSAIGPTSEPKGESALCCPNTEYGASKFSSEQVYKNWRRSHNNRELVIVRPGVVYGPGEIGGNIPRMINAIKKNYFFYMGNKNIYKAGIYIEELSLIFLWLLKQNKINEDIIANATFYNCPRLKDYVEVICLVLNKSNNLFTLPRFIFEFFAFIMNKILNLFKIQHPFHPLRIKKLNFSNNMLPSYLLENGYVFKYSLPSSFKHWHKNHIQDF